MSRVAKAAINLPGNVEFQFDNHCVSMKGPKGQLHQKLNKQVLITKSENVLQISPVTDKDWAQAGTARAIVNNMVKGVTEGFLIALEIKGVGYRAQAAGKKLNLSLGFSHPVEFDVPEGITIETPNPTTINISGASKQLVGEVAAKICDKRPPEPYNGKGIKPVGKQIARKEAKKK